MTQPEETPDDEISRLVEFLNAQANQQLEQRKSSFFFPATNGSEDPHGIKAFHQGDLDINRFLLNRIQGWRPSPPSIPDDSEQQSRS